MGRVRLLRFRMVFRNCRLPILFFLSLLLGCAFVLVFPPDTVQAADEPSLRAAVSAALMSPRCMLLTASVYALCFLISGLSMSAYGACLFCLGMVTASCASFLFEIFGAVGALIIACLFLPRLCLLCYFTVDLCRQVKPHVMLYLLGTLLLFLAQFFLNPLLLSPLFESV